MVATTAMAAIIASAERRNCRDKTDHDQPLHFHAHAKMHAAARMAAIP